MDVDYPLFYEFNASHTSTLTCVNDYDYDYYSHRLNVTNESPVKIAQPLYGYFVPFILVVTIIANTLIVLVLSKRYMRTPTNAVLMARALCDMLALLLSAPWLFFMYTLGNHNKPLSPAGLCYTYKFMREVMPGIFHIASIWLTLALAVQRYIYVCHEPVSRTFCTMSRVIKGIFFIGITAGLCQSTRFIDRDYKLIQINWEGRCEYVCQESIADWVKPHVDRYLTFYYMFQMIFVHLLPCIALVVLNVLLFRALREAQRKRQHFLEDNNISESRKIQDTNCTTLMIIVVVTVFLIVEIPLAAVISLFILPFLCYNIISRNCIVEFIDYDIGNVLIVVSDFFIILSYPIYFAIYYGMSRQFRETVKKLFIRDVVPGNKNGGSSRHSFFNGPRTSTNETGL